MPKGQYFACNHQKTSPKVHEYSFFADITINMPCKSLFSYTSIAL